MEYVINDQLGNRLAVGDTVRITAFGFGARIADVDVESKITAIFETRVAVTDADGQTRRVGGAVLLKRALKVVESEPADAQCPTCGRLFKNERAVKSHSRVHAVIAEALAK